MRGLDLCSLAMSWLMAMYKEVVHPAHAVGMAFLMVAHCLCVLPLMKRCMSCSLTFFLLFHGCNFYIIFC